MRRNGGAHIAMHRLWVNQHNTRQHITPHGNH